MAKYGEEIVLIETFGHPQTRTNDRNFDGERNLSINCHELRYLRRYLLIVGQWYPEEWSSIKKNVYHVWQLFVTLGVWAYFFYSFGCFGNLALGEQYLRRFPVSAIEDMVCESRWIVSHHLGLYYFCRRRHLEKFLEESSLNQALWKETSRYLKRICAAVIMLVLVIPVILHPAELSYELQLSDMWKIVLDTIVLALDRLVSAPIFLVFVFVAYVVVRVVKSYVECIKTWPKEYKNREGCGMRAAKMHFRNIKRLIRSVENAFQLYLSLHFFSLLLTAFLGVFACVEQLENKMITNRSYEITALPKYYKRVKISPAVIINHPVHVTPGRVPSQKLSLPALLPSQELSRRKLVNVTETRGQSYGSFTDDGKKQILIEVGIEAVLKILESIVLYMIPLTLMLRLQTKLRLVRQAIVDSDCFEQKDNGYLFQDEESIRTMCEFVSTCSGITIFGYKMPLFRTFMLSVLAPFLTALTTYLFSYIHVKQR